MNSDNDKGLNADEMCLLKPEDFKAVSLGFTDEDEKKVGFAV